MSAAKVIDKFKNKPVKPPVAYPANSGASASDDEPVAHYASQVAYDAETRRVLGDIDICLAADDKRDEKPVADPKAKSNSTV